jgi:hypothetical protein
MKIKDATALWLDTARFWLERVAECDRQTVEDVLALLQWPEEIKHLKWAKTFGAKQVFTSATMRAMVLLGELRMIGKRVA